MFHENKHNLGLIRGQIREKLSSISSSLFYNAFHLLSVLSHWLPFHNKTSQAKAGPECYGQEKELTNTVPHPVTFLSASQALERGACLQILGVSPLVKESIGLPVYQIDSQESGASAWILQSLLPTSELYRWSLMTFKTRTRP